MEADRWYLHGAEPMSAYVLLIVLTTGTIGIDMCRIERPAYVR